MSATTRLLSATSLVGLVGLQLPIHAGVTVFPQDLGGFNLAAGSPPIAIHFDAIAAGTAIGGSTLAGVTFVETGSPLLVVRGADTSTPGTFAGLIDPATNQLLPTSGDNVLSPGGLTLGPGSNPAVESDSLTLEFVAGVRAFGFDHLSQSADGFSFTSISVYDRLSALLYTGAVPISNVGNLGGGAPGGADFWGIVSDVDIGRVIISEDDGDATYPDCNIGFDSFRFHPVPEPSQVGLLFAALSAGCLWTRRARG